MASLYEPGTRCWVKDDKEGWIGATVEEKSVDDNKVVLQLKTEKEDDLTVEATEEEIANHSDKLPPLRNPPILEATEDLTSLSYLNEPAVLHAIRMRYRQLNIYTYSGIVLIATNPFQKIDSLYTPDIIQAYSGKRRGELEPHLFAIAEDAYRCMLRDQHNQTIVVSGESGAGKTVSAKFIMRYFATVEDPEHPRKNAGSESISKTEEQILATNPIMEAFGNAKTTRNDNSSRFGKYLEILFNKDIDIIGAKIRTYLLERSRLVFQPPTERNYHIFYQLCSGATPEEKESFGLTAIENFHYLNQGGDSKLPNIDDAQEFAATKEALETIGIDSQSQSQIFKILAGLLHIGNIEITPTRTNAVLNSDEPSLLKATELLGLDAEGFAKWIIKKQIVTRSEKIISNLNHQQAVVVRDSVAKFIYSALFDWLVHSINQGLATPEILQHVNSFIGVLDIYGFEHFKKNSFEQFCINYANEKLQQEFNQHVFKLEQDEYLREEIEWTFIDFSDNQPCITLIEAKLGILSLLDEESRLPSGSDQTWVEKLYQHFDTPTHTKFFQKPRFGKSAFIVNHYAMDVSYESEGFIEKNRDTVPDEHLEVLMESSNEFLKSVLDFTHESSSSTTTTTTTGSDKPGAVARPRAVPNRKPTLGGIFKNSLIELMKTINSTNVHYIRCIKPNEAKQAWMFDGPMVLSQLRACGVLETIRISCDGFPTRWTYEEFADRYYMLTPSVDWTNSDVKQFCKIILDKCIAAAGKYQLGKTKIFFRAGMLAWLEKLRSDRLNDCAIVIQKNLRMMYWRKQFNLTRQSIIKLQAAARASIARCKTQKLRETKAAIVLQKYWRGYQQRTEYTQATDSILALQSVIRGWSVRHNILQNRYNSAAISIQRSWRGFIVRREYKDTVKKISLIQNLWRIKLAKEELAQLRQEARSVTHYKEVQYHLESKVVQLTQNLTDHKNDNKKLKDVIESLNEQLVVWQNKHAESEALVASLERNSEDSKKSNAEKVTTIQTQLDKLVKQYDQAVLNYQALETEKQRIESILLEKEQALTASQETIKDYEQSNNNLLDTVEELRRNLDAITAKASLSAMDLNNGTMLTSIKRSNKRRSLVDNFSAKEMSSFAPRPASVMYSDLKRVPSNTSDDGDAFSQINTELEKILDNYKILCDEVVQGVIYNLKIPVPSTTEDIPPKEILFPAHIISMVTSEMWRMGYVKESEEFLGQVMHAIQETVIRDTGEDIINPGAFWISNVHEIWSFICVAQANFVASEVLRDELGLEMFQEYNKLVEIAKQDLENLEFNIYHAWMKQLKKSLDKIIVPAVVLSQSLPGFITPESTRFFNKMFPSSQSQPATMDDLLSLFNKVYKAMKGYYLSPDFMKMPILELLRLVGVKSFNDLLMRRNFASWKRGLQINYNVTRIEEWCKAHDISEGVIPLEHIMESVKLLQLKKVSLEDIDILYDICWTLTPLQIQKLINQYLNADYEPPISDDILNTVAARVKNDDSSTQLMLEAIPLDDSGPYELVDPRPLQKLESYVPGWLQVPNVKRLCDLTAMANDMNATAAGQGMGRENEFSGFDEEYDEKMVNGFTNGQHPGDLVDPGIAISQNTR